MKAWRGHLVAECNVASRFDFQNVNYEWYIAAARKLVYCMTQVGDLDGILSRVGTWRVNGYTALNNAATVASAVAIGYVTQRAGRYELTDAGIDRLRSVEGDAAAERAARLRG